MEILSITKKMMLMLMMIMITMMVNIAKCEQHYVGGGKATWAPGVNLTEWSLHQQFHVDDWLYFGYDKNMYNVLEVNKTSYEKCVEADFIKNITRGAGRDVFQLTEIKTYYFLSGRGFCWNGMKVAVDVTGNVAQAPGPTPHHNGGHSTASGFLINHKFFVLILTFIWTINY